MTLTPFAHPKQPMIRTHAPDGYTDYKSFKPWLRDEFAFRCVYCLVRERWYPSGADAFSVEHVLPQSSHPHLVCHYPNLLYACCRCNSQKRDRELLDPVVDPLGVHLLMLEDAMYAALTNAGQDLIDQLDLNDPRLLETRKLKLHLLTLQASYPNDPEVQALFRDAFGYPDDLPDLRELRPPGGNANPQGAQDCHFARREAGRLPAIN